MSFLLRKPRGRTSSNGPASSVPHGMHRTIVPQSKAIVSGRQPMISRSSGGGQMQQLLQRPPVQQNTTAQKIVPQQKQTRAPHVSQDTQKQIQGVISMDEVMEDLRVLEQQQRESQRKLATVKLSKQNKLEQRASLEDQLSCLKYSNGEQRAQLLRARDVLSQSTRELGSAKLRFGRSGESLKAFDNRLKRALLSARSLQVTRRKIDAETIVLRNMESILLRLKTEVIQHVKDAEKHRDKVKNHELSLRKAIQDLTLKGTSLLEEATNVRSDISGLEQDLTGAQQMEASTKLRAGSIVSEISMEEQRHKDEILAMESKLEEYKGTENDLAQKEVSMENDVETKRSKLQELWKWYIQSCRHEEGPDPRLPSEGSSGPVIDIDSVRLELDSEEKAFDAELAVMEKLRASVKQQRDELSALECNDAASRQEATETRQSAEASQQVERDRRVANEKVLLELESDRQAVQELQRSVSELDISRSEEIKRLTVKHTEQAQSIDAAQARFDDLKSHIDISCTSIIALKKAWELEKVDLAESIENAKKSADNARMVFEEVRDKTEAFKKRSDVDIQKEIDDIERAQGILVEDTNDDIEHILSEYQQLTGLQIIYDPDLTKEEHTKIALSTLQAECDNRVNIAREKRQTIIDRLEREREATEAAKLREEAIRVNLMRQKALEKEEAVARKRAAANEAEHKQRIARQRREAQDAADIESKSRLVIARVATELRRTSSARHDEPIMSEGIESSDSERRDEHQIGPRKPHSSDDSQSDRAKLRRISKRRHQEEEFQRSVDCSDDESSEVFPSQKSVRWEGLTTSTSERMLAQPMSSNDKRKPIARTNSVETNKGKLRMKSYGKKDRSSSKGGTTSNRPGGISILKARGHLGLSRGDKSFEISPKTLTTTDKVTEVMKEIALGSDNQRGKTDSYRVRTSSSSTSRHIPKTPTTNDDLTEVMKEIASGSDKQKSKTDRSRVRTSSSSTSRDSRTKRPSTLLESSSNEHTVDRIPPSSEPRPGGSLKQTNKRKTSSSTSPVNARSSIRRKETSNRRVQVYGSKHESALIDTTVTSIRPSKTLTIRDPTTTTSQVSNKERRRPEASQKASQVVTQKRGRQDEKRASQVSGISSTERATNISSLSAPKSRRRKKKDGLVVGRPKTQSFGVMGGVQDFDFRF